MTSSTQTRHQKTICHLLAIWQGHHVLHSNHWRGVGVGPGHRRFRKKSVLCTKLHPKFASNLLSNLSHSPARTSEGHGRERRRSVSPAAASRHQEHKSVQVLLAEAQVRKQREQELEAKRQEEEALARIEGRRKGHAEQPSEAARADSRPLDKLGHGGDHHPPGIHSRHSHDGGKHHSHSHHHSHHSHSHKHGHHSHHDKTERAHQERIPDENGHIVHHAKGAHTHAYPLIGISGASGQGIGGVRARLLQTCEAKYHVLVFATDKPELALSFAGE